MRKWDFYTTKEIKPRGWLKRQLQLQAQGLCGNLDKIWPDVRDSAWIGGDREGWERVPYWLDGFIPLAYLLEDEDMIARAKKYIDAILAAQQEDGWICPCTEEERPAYTTWAILLITKALVVYYDCSADARIPEVIYRTMKNYYNLLSAGTIKLFGWTAFRWYEGFIALQFLQERYDEPWIVELGKILQQQGVDYDTLIPLWERPLNKWEFETHLVNAVMMLKQEAVSCDMLGLPYTDRAERHLQLLQKFNGTPVETFTGDECLPVSDWNYAYCSDIFTREEWKVGDVIFSSQQPPVVLKAKVRKINWGLEDGYETVCAKVPQSREPVSEEEEIALYPYGCAKLRMTELPKI